MSHEGSEGSKGWPPMAQKGVNVIKAEGKAEQGNQAMIKADLSGIDMGKGI